MAGLLIGKRNVMIRDAHTRLLRGSRLPVELTAACFDPGQLLLLTGARDGTLKVQLHLYFHQNQMILSF